MKKLRVNILCLVGSLIGIIAIFLPWASASNWSEVFYYDLIYTAQWNPALVILFILGTGLSFITSLGAVIQFISFLCAGTEYWYYFTWGMLPSDYGLLCALISFILIVLSMFLLISIPPLKKPYSLKMRLLTFTRADTPGLPIQTNDKPNVENAQ
jgi:hypothetical protein